MSIKRQVRAEVYNDPDIVYDSISSQPLTDDILRELGQYIKVGNYEAIGIIIGRNAFENLERTIHLEVEYYRGFKV